MYHKIECVTLECDNCKESYTNDHSGFSIFVDENSVCEDAEEGGWYMQTENGKHYCPNCHSISEDDAVYIKTLPIPEEGSGQEEWTYLQDN